MTAAAAGKCIDTHRHWPPWRTALEHIKHGQLRRPRHADQPGRDERNPDEQRQPPGVISAESDPDSQKRTGCYGLPDTPGCAVHREPPIHTDPAIISARHRKSPTHITDGGLRVNVGGGD
ncbi:hypothetical protein [Mycolicibacterium agri]|uniref:hypothetical protein n=1 Tax=Mycolicibacterium agri TaxID=36811 RepID=UPI0013FD3BE2|nr:hypothetical protein [Mycolicibacterium agri]